MRKQHALGAAAIVLSHLAVSLLMAGAVQALAADAPSASQPAKATLDVAAIDKGRILKAANAALKMEPLTITKYTAKHSDLWKNLPPDPPISRCGATWPSPSRCCGSAKRPPGNDRLIPEPEKMQPSCSAWYILHGSQPGTVPS
jgi:hypothetical protein